MTRKLSDSHYNQLKSSAIADNVIESRGYFTCQDPKELLTLGDFTNYQVKNVSPDNTALVIPYYDLTGKIKCYAFKPDNPLINSKNQVIKYLVPIGTPNFVLTHPIVLDKIKDVEIRLDFTEGVKKVDSLVSKNLIGLGLNGVTGFRTKVNEVKQLIPDLELIPLDGREVILWFDSDLATNKNVKAAINRFAKILDKFGAKVIPILIPSPNGLKIGIDDYIASNPPLSLDYLVSYFSVLSPNLDFSTKRKWSTDKIKQEISSEYSIKINDMNDTVYINDKIYDDTQEAKFKNWARDLTIPIDHGLTSLIELGDENRYHPIKNYLENLPKWDEKDHLENLISYIDGDKDNLRIFLKKFMLGSIARVYKEGTRNFTLVIVGNELIGKSYFAKWLCPIERLFIETPIKSNDKDTRIRVCSYWLWELGELAGTLSVVERNALKHILTMTHVTDRLSYGKRDIYKPATVSFIGTENGLVEFLSSFDLNTRFAIVNVEKFDRAYSKKIDINKLWSQIFELYKNGESWELDDNEIEIQLEQNRRYQKINPYLELLEEYFNIDTSYQYQYADKNQFSLTTKDIIDILSQKVISSRIDLLDTRTTTYIRLALRQLGLKESNPRKMFDDKGDTGKQKRFWDGIWYDTCYKPQKSILNLQVSSEEEDVD